MIPNLDIIESKIIEYATASLNRFAKEHKEEKFYGFGLDVNATYGGILLCFNTEEDFEKTSQEYIKKWNYTKKDLEDLKLNFGDWKYQGFNLNYEEWQNWNKYANDIKNYIIFDDDEFMTEEEEDKIFEETEKFSNDFLISCTNALLKLEKSGIFEQFEKEDDFFIQVIDHDEDEDEAKKRFELVKKKFV